MSVCVCMWFSKPLRLPVGVCVYIRLCASILVQLIHVHNSILLFSLLLKAVSSFTISLSFPYASVLYTFFPCIFLQLGSLYGFRSQGLPRMYGMHCIIQL